MGSKPVATRWVPDKGTVFDSPSLRRLKETVCREATVVGVANLLCTFPSSPGRCRRMAGNRT